MRWLPNAITALFLLAVCLLLYDRYLRAKSGLPPMSRPSRLYRWLRVIWAVVFGAFMLWVLAGWMTTWFAKR